MFNFWSFSIPPVYVLQSVSPARLTQNLLNTRSVSYPAYVKKGRHSESSFSKTYLFQFLSVLSVLFWCITLICFNLDARTNELSRNLAQSLLKHFWVRELKTSVFCVCLFRMCVCFSFFFSVVVAKIMFEARLVWDPEVLGPYHLSVPYFLWISGRVILNPVWSRHWSCRWVGLLSLSRFLVREMGPMSPCSLSS